MFYIGCDIIENKRDTILVEIVAYREQELLNTVNSALIQADYPERISFSICYQSNDLSDYEKLKKINNCKIKYLREDEARGCCYARYLCQQMIDDEKYIYQIDAHMRFVKHWDTKLIEQLLSIGDDKAIISYYPPDCTEDMMTLPLDDSIFDKPASGGYMRASCFREDSPSLVECNCYLLGNENGFEYRRGIFISGGNFFSFADVHRKVLNDPDMYFYADEIAMSIRLFTHGYNVYSTNESYIYHQYNRPNRYFPSIPNSIENEEDRFLNLIGLKNDNIDFGEFGLGTERTLEEYMKFSGVDFKNRIIYSDQENA